MNTSCFRIIAFVRPSTRRQCHNKSSVPTDAVVISGDVFPEAGYGSAEEFGPATMPRVLNAIVAVCPDLGIGKNGDLPWHPIRLEYAPAKRPDDAAILFSTLFLLQLHVFTLK